MTTKPANASEQMLREVAYSIWEDAGRPMGQAELHWEMAQALMKSPEVFPAQAPVLKTAPVKKASTKTGKKTTSRTGPSPFYQRASRSARRVRPDPDRNQGLRPAF